MNTSDISKKKVNPQGYNYGIDPINTNPFWEEDSEPGGSGDSTNIKNVTATVDDTSGAPDVVATLTDDTLNFAFTGLKGEKGDTGDQGPEGPRGPEGPEGPKGPAGKDGKDGTIENFTATATVDDTTGTPNATATVTGTNIAFAFTGLKGEKGDTGDQGPEGPRGPEGPEGPRGPEGPEGPKGPAGKDGITPDITAIASVSDTTGTPSVSVKKTGDDTAPQFEFSFTGLKGEKGETGKQGPEGPEGPRGPEGPEGPRGPEGPEGPKGPEGPEGPKGPAGKDGKDGTIENFTATATVDDTTGTPNATATVTGTNIAFAFTGLKGEKGDTGDQGPEGPRGPEGPEGPRGPEGPEGPKGPAGKDGITPDITAIASVSDTTGTPSVSVKKTGDDTAPQFEFSFSGLKGEKGEKGEQGPEGPAGADGSLNDVEVTASIDESSGEPSVDVTVDGNTLDFSFSGLKGERGEKGATGDPGPEGPRGPRGLKGPEGPAGKDADISEFVSNVSMSSNGSAYAIFQKENGTDFDVGRFYIPIIESTGIWSVDNRNIIISTYVHPGIDPSLRIGEGYEISVGSNSDSFNIVDDSENIFCAANDVNAYKRFVMLTNYRYNLDICGSYVKLSGIFKAWDFNGFAYDDAALGDVVYVEFHFKASKTNETPDNLTDKISLTGRTDNSGFWFKVIGARGQEKKYHVNILDPNHIDYDIDYAGLLVRPKGDKETAGDISTIPDEYKIIRLIKYTKYVSEH